MAGFDVRKHREAEDLPTLTLSDGTVLKAVRPISVNRGLELKEVWDSFKGMSEDDPKKLLGAIDLAKMVFDAYGFPVQRVCDDYSQVEVLAALASFFESQKGTESASPPPAT